MTTKKVKELTYDDLGKQVVLTEPNGDRASGDLKMIIFSKSIRLEIGDSAHGSVDPESEIQVGD